MSDVIDLLERMGQDAQWSLASPDDIQLALADAKLEPELQVAIATGDQQSLETLLGLSPLCGMLVPGKEDEKEDEDTEELPPGDDDEKPENSLSHQQASAS